MKSFVLMFIIVFLPSQLLAQKELGVFSPAAVLAIATYEKLYIFKEDYIDVHLGKELSYTYFYSKPYNNIFQYSITANFLDGDTWIESCILLPEIGNWSIVSYHILNTAQKATFANNITFILKCELYESNTVIYTEYSPLRGLLKVELKEIKYISSNWYCDYYGSRPSTENICHIRYAREPLYNQSIADKKFEIAIVKDTSYGSPIRLTDHYDDIFFYHNDNVKDNHPADFTCFIVPRIFFVKFEEPSLSIDIEDNLSPIRFTIIVQQFEDQEKTAWNYHRLEIVREQSAHEIQINDLGPVPRSEWEPGWPDPAVTPLWKKPESECAQCQ